jgi:ribosomal protein L3 glutamine methyltransferase
MDRSGNPIPRPESGVTLAGLADWAEAVLTEAELAYGHGTDNARDEAVWLLLAALGRSPVTADVDPVEPVDADGIAAVAELLARRRENRVPTAYLTGTAWFAGLPFTVDRRALVPRSPLAEPIAARFSPWLDAERVRRILEIGTGCGCIAVACARAFPEARVDATDTDSAALELAAENLRRHDLEARVTLWRADVYDGLPSGRAYDLIVSNPPYVDEAAMARLPAEYRAEPRHALAGGPDGLAIVERILAGAREWLAPGGLLMVETGRAGAALEQRHPRCPFTWLAFEHGGEGVFALRREDLPDGETAAGAG